MAAEHDLTTRAAPSRVALLAGLLVALALAGVDLALGDRSIVIAAVVAAPFVTALLGGPRETVAVGAAALAIALASPVWNHNLGEPDYIVRLGIVVAGGAVGAVAARARMRAAVNGRRFDVLAAAARISDGRIGVERTVERLQDLIVPDLADVCVLDYLRGDRLERLSVRALGPGAQGVASALRERGADPLDPSAPGGGPLAGRSLLLERIGEAALAGRARDAGDLALLRSLDLTSCIVVPLWARGRALGTITLLTRRPSGRRYGEADLRFAEVLSGRAALALDNAGLFSELEIAEARLSAALGGLAEAVTVQDAAGRLIYANAAAASALGFGSPEELLATPPEAIVERFESFNEDGTPMRLDQLPGRRVLAGERPEPLVLRSIRRDTGEERWRVTKATAVTDAEGRPVMAVNVIEDITDVKRAEQTQRLLAEAGEVLSSSLDYGETLQRVAELAVPELADWCVVSLPDGRGRIATVAVAHADPGKVAMARELSERYPARADAPSGAPRVIREGRALIENEITPEMLAAAARDPEHLELLRGVGMRSAMILPMTIGARTIGALSLVNAESGRAVTPAAERLAQELARRAATAVDTARLYTERTHIATTLERGLRPPDLPELPGWSAATLYRPAGEFTQVGGDFYDAFPTPDGLFAVIGDVVGQGAEAATLTSLARFTLRAAGQLTGEPAVAARQLNATLVDRPELSLCTAVCARLERRPDGGARARIACCGHPLPLLVRDGGVSEAGRPGPILGAGPREDWPVTELDLRPGDTLVLYTDGITEALGERERFGEERLVRCLGEGPCEPEGLVAHLVRTLDAFQLPGQRDDTAVLALRLDPVPAAVPAGDRARD
jgi:PAS domain S-box-containing protein